MEHAEHTSQHSGVGGGEGGGKGNNEQRIERNIFTVGAVVVVQVVSVLTISTDDTSSNPAWVKSISVKFVFEKDENKQKEAMVGPFKNIFCI